jgi:hypothetical protein
MWCVPQTAKIGECFRSAEFLTCDNAQIAIKVNGIFTRNTNQDRAETAIGAPARALKVMQDSGECEPRVGRESKRSRGFYPLILPRAPIRQTGEFSTIKL